MLTAIVIIIVLAVIAVLGIAAMRPDSFRVERWLDRRAPGKDFSTAGGLPQLDAMVAVGTDGPQPAAVL